MTQSQPIKFPTLSTDSTCIDTPLCKQRSFVKASASSPKGSALVAGILPIAGRAPLGQLMPPYQVKSHYKNNIKSRSTLMNSTVPLSIV